MRKTRVVQINKYTKENTFTKGQRRKLKRIYNKLSKPNQAVFRHGLG